MHVCKAGVTHFRVLKEVLREENGGGGGGGEKVGKAKPMQGSNISCPVVRADSLFPLSPRHS